MNNTKKIPSINFNSLDNWSENTIENITTIKSCNTPSTKNNDYYHNGDIPIVLRLDITSNANKYLYKTRKFVNKVVLKESGQFLCKKNNIIINLYNGDNIGLPVINKIDCIASEGMMFVECKNINVESLYYYILFNKKWVNKNKILSTLSSIEKSKIKQMPICFPSLKEQEKIGLFFKYIDELINLTNLQNQKLLKMVEYFKSSSKLINDKIHLLMEHNNLKINKYKNIKQSLMQKMFI